MERQEERGRGGVDLNPHFLGFKIASPFALQFSAPNP